MASTSLVLVLLVLMLFESMLLVVRMTASTLLNQVSRVCKAYSRMSGRLSMHAVNTTSNSAPSNKDEEGDGEKEEEEVFMFSKERFSATSTSTAIVTDSTIQALLWVKVWVLLWVCREASSNTDNTARINALLASSGRRERETARPGNRH